MGLHRCYNNKEPQHDKNKLTCVPSKDSDQPGHSPSLISLRCALNLQPGTQSFFMWTAKTDQTGRMSSLGAQFILLGLSCCGSYINVCQV